MSKASEYLKNRRLKDPVFKLKHNIRVLINTIIKIRGFNKNGKIYNYIGCSKEEFKKHIELQFDDKMNWENHGKYGWHIDHIIPLSSAKNIEEVYKLNHYSNLRPLWCIENYKKGSKIYNVNNENKINFNSYNKDLHKSNIIYFNRKKKSGNNTSNYTGVYLHSDKINWRAVITKNKQKYHLGLFKLEIDAAMAYNKKAIELYGKNAILNKIEDIK